MEAHGLGLDQLIRKRTRSRAEEGEKKIEGLADRMCPIPVQRGKTDWEWSSVVATKCVSSPKRNP